MARIALCCATERGLRVLRELISLTKGHEVIVCSFPEEQHEPPFLEAIKKCAEEGNATFYEARNLASAKHAEFWSAHPFDIIFFVSWRYLVPKAFYAQAKQGAFVFHDSLLPKNRGFSPTVWAMINGEKETGVTLFEMDETVDSGPILDQVRIPIGENETIAMVMEKVTQGYLELLRKNLGILMNGQALRREQDSSQATYTCKRLPEDNRIYWQHHSAIHIHNLIRAVTKPYPGAYCYCAGKRIRIWSAELLVSHPVYVGIIPGRIVEVKPGEGVVVLSKDGKALLIKALSLEDQAIVSADRVLTSLNMTLE